MRMLWGLACGLAVSGVSCRDVVAHRRQPQPANDGASSIALFSDTSAALASSSSSISPLPSTFSPTASTSSSMSITSASSQNMVTPTTASSKLSYITSQNSSANNATSSRDLDKQLPIPPKITPAIGMAGVILLVTGIVYGMVGIKHKGICTFFSVAYLAVLAVTVLILYVMNPPVSDGVQGAFLVAALACGCIFGGLSLIFHEITICFGCILGGFCLSMWFLTLSPGGLIQSQGMRILFILIFTIAVGSLSILKVTRDYGLIASLPFSGATAAVLGIDCFSRAGMKEFWIYIWALNDDEFPLNTNTYPVTRGMRVESAAVILIFLVGLAAQLKLFKVLRDRRREKAESRQRLDDQRDREERAIGRILERGVNRDLARWESIYGGQPGAGANFDSSETFAAKEGVIYREKSMYADQVELSDLGSSKGSDMAKDWRHSARQMPAYGAGLTITVQNEGQEPETIHEIDDHGNSVERRRSKAQLPSDTAANEQNENKSQRNSEVLEDDCSSPRLSQRNSVSPAPAVVPLPFRIPSSAGDSMRSPSDRNSVPNGQEGLLRRGSKRLSQRASSLFKSIAGDSVVLASASQEDLIDAADAVVDDAASSIAATIDELDEDAVSLPALSIRSSNNDNTASEYHLEQSETAEEKQEDQCKTIALTSTYVSSTLETPHQPMVASSLGRDGPESSTRHSTSDEKRKSRDANGAISTASSPSKKRQSINSQTRPTTAVTKEVLEQLPAALSKVVLNYRTNEWSKHLSIADAPESQTVEASSPGIKVDTAFQAELAKNSVSVDPASIVGGEAPLISYAGAGEAPPPTSPVKAPNTTEPPPPAGKRTSNPFFQSTSEQPSNATTAPRPGSSGHPRPPSRAGSMHSVQPIYNMHGMPSAGGSAIIEEGVAIHTLAGDMSMGSTGPPFTKHSGRTMSTGGRSISAGAVPAYTNSSFVTSPVEIPQHSAFQGSYFAGVGYGAQQLQHASEFAPPLPEEHQAYLEHHRRMSTASNHGRASRSGSRTVSQGFVTGMQNFSHSPSASAMNLENFNSHQPRRERSRPRTGQQGRERSRSRTASQQRGLSWRESLNRDAMPYQANTPPAADEARRAAMIAEKRNDAFRAQQKQMQIAQRDSTFDTMMRRADMQDAHREAMRRMQAGANTQ